MKTGLLWFDDDPGRTLDEKIVRAIKRYRKKYSEEPSVCYVHPKDFEEVAGIKVEMRSTVLRHHLWMGREDES